VGDRVVQLARECATLIETVAHEALAELARLTGEGGPPPSLSRVDQLAGRARAAGLAVTLSVDGRPGAVPPGIDLAAFRIVQEALANTAKHARAEHAWVTVRYAPRAIDVEIADDGRGRGHGRRNGGGHGLIGMRERVALYGGSFDAGPRARGRGYRVRARLPLDAA
jgi:signal transduction histidine kinase